MKLDPEMLTVEDFFSSNLAGMYILNEVTLSLRNQICGLGMFLVLASLLAMAKLGLVHQLCHILVAPQLDCCNKNMHGGYP